MIKKRVVKSFVIVIEIIREHRPAFAHLALIAWALLLFCGCNNFLQHHNPIFQDDYEINKIGQIEIVDTCIIVLPQNPDASYSVNAANMFEFTQKGDTVFIQAPLYKFLGTVSTQLGKWTNIRIIPEEQNAANVARLDDDQYLIATEDHQLLKVDYGQTSIKLDTLANLVVSNSYMLDKLVVIGKNSGNPRLVLNKFDTLQNQFRYSIYSFKDSVIYYTGKSFHYYEEKELDYIYPIMEFPTKVDIDSITMVAWPYHHYGLLYNNLSGKFCETIDLKSNFINSDKITGLEADPSPEYQELNNYIVSQPFYLGLIYNHFDRKIYRIVKHQSNLLDGNGMVNERYSGKWSIIAVDLNTRQKVEYNMTAEIFNMFCVIPHPEGLAVLKKNVAQNRKGVYEFYIIKLK